MTLDQGFEQLKTLVETELCERSKSAERKLADTLNQTVRRLRQAGSESDVVGLLVTYGNDSLVCITFDGTRARVGSSNFAVEEAPALLSVIESKDTVVTLIDSRELSETLTMFLDWEGKAHLVPIVVGNAVRSVIAAPGDVAIASLELLCEVAGMRLQILEQERAPAPLVQISAPKAGGTKWEDLTLADQAMHLRAQHFAQVAVARMRVEHQASVQDGQRRGDIYRALRTEIDEARAEYRRQFLALDSKTMVDYLYLELVRSLANDEEQLLGTGFPGRLT